MGYVSIVAAHVSFVIAVALSRDGDHTRSGLTPKDNVSHAERGLALGELALRRL